MAGGIDIEFPVAGAVVLPLVNAVKIRFAVVLRGVLAPVHLEDVNRVSLEPVQPVVVVIAPIAAVAGAGRFAGLPPAVERPYAGYRDFSRAAVLIAGRQRGQDEGTEQNQGRMMDKKARCFFIRKCSSEFGYKKNA